MKKVTNDPVCGMDVAEDSEFHTLHDNVQYFFCSQGCLRQFENHPENYTGGSAPEKDGESRDNADDQNVKKREEGRGSSWKDYIPLAVIVALTMAGAVAKQAHYGGGWDWMLWMHDFMGFFLVVFSMFKFFDLGGFADGFQMYDLLAKPFRPYAFLYPFLELGLGLGYLSHWQPMAIYAATVVLMVFGSLGVFRALSKGLDLECACMGTTLSVPLSTVALVEDLGMATMAAIMLAMNWG